MKWITVRPDCRWDKPRVGGLEFGKRYAMQLEDAEVTAEIAGSEFLEVSATKPTNLSIVSKSGLTIQGVENV